MKHVGIDLSKTVAQIYVVEARMVSGRVKLERRGEKTVKARVAPILGYLRRFKGPLEVVVESTGAWWWLERALRGEGYRFVLAHPREVRAIAESVKKCDRHDARVLAELAAMGRLPKAHIASEQAREDRQRVRHRAELARIGTRAKNHITAILDRNGLTPPWKNVFTQRGTTWLRGQTLPEAEREALEDWLGLLETVEGLEREAQGRIESRAEGNAGVALLRTIPRFGTMTATALLAAIDGVERFPRGKQLGAYFGLVPIVRSSGETVRHGSITKRGDRWLRWLLVQAAWRAVQEPGPLQEFYQRMRRRKGNGKKAIVAVAHKLCVIAHAMLRTGETYRRAA